MTTGPSPQGPGPAPTITEDEPRRVHLRIVGDSPTNTWFIRAAGHASGGWLIGRHRARAPQTCSCCSCSILRGEIVYEVLTATDVLTECCAMCAGAPVTRRQ